MDDSWRELDYKHERLRWARVRRTDFERPTDAAKAMNIKPGTYRTYEHAKADGGRWPPPPVLQQIADKYGVSWVWLETGEGSPDDAPSNPLALVVSQVAEKMGAIPEAKRSDAVSAIYGVLDAFASKTG